MKYAIDLHIHSALSPCAADDMTPNNIINMAILKGLDIIAITDHNSCDNIEAVMEVGGDDIFIIPGMEVQSKEEVHLLCYFTDLDTIFTFDSIIRAKLPKILNDPNIFGNQYIMDSFDNIVSTRDELLLTSVDMTVDEITQEVRRLDGLVIPAHVDRMSYSILSQLGFIPSELEFSTLEVSDLTAIDELNLKGYNYILSSDAHFLGDIMEREMFVDLQYLDAYELLSLFRK
ncbi:MAG TPA: PHP domain-containing protein [Clostridiales bacterium]|nr:PHP domain-containing protein [Clostridiales bacterium]